MKTILLFFMLLACVGISIGQPISTPAQDMTTFQEVVTGLLGNYSFAFYITFFLLVLIGIIGSNCVAISTRNKSSVHSPVKFDFWFWLKDNGQRMASSLVLVFIMIRFGEEMFHVVPTYLGAIGIGLAFDQFLFRIRQALSKSKKAMRSSS